MVLILFVLATSNREVAQGQRVVKPQSVGLTSEQLERIGKLVQKGIDEKRKARAVSLVIRYGQVA
jgi:hypothetical protein